MISRTASLFVRVANEILENRDARVALFDLGADGFLGFPVRGNPFHPQPRSWAGGWWGSLQIRSM